MSATAFLSIGCIKSEKLSGCSPDDSRELNSFFFGFPYKVTKLCTLRVCLGSLKSIFWELSDSLELVECLPSSRLAGWHSRDCFLIGFI